MRPAVGAFRPRDAQASRRGSWLAPTGSRRRGRTPLRRILNGLPGAWNPFRKWVLSQKGFRAEPPQRHSVARGKVSTVPSSRRTWIISPVTRSGPFPHRLDARVGLLRIAVEPSKLERSARAAEDRVSNDVRVSAVGLNPGAPLQVEYVGERQQALADVDAPVQVEADLDLVPAVDLSFHRHLVDPDGTALGCRGKPPTTSCSDCTGGAQASARPDDLARSDAVLPASASVTSRDVPSATTTADSSLAPPRWHSSTTMKSKKSAGYSPKYGLGLEDRGEGSVGPSHVGDSITSRPASTKAGNRPSSRALVDTSENALYACWEFTNRLCATRW